MSHESVWYSRPRTYGKGARGWYVSTPMIEWQEKEIEDRQEMGIVWWSREIDCDG